MSETIPRSTEVVLAILETKIDNIIANQKANSEEIKSVERHAMAAINAQGEAFRELLKQKTDAVQSQARYEEVDARLKNTEDTQKWLGRAVLGAVVAAGLGFILTTPDKIKSDPQHPPVIASVLPGGAK